MTIGGLLLVLGGFLLGGAWSFWRLDRGAGKGRSAAQIVLAVILLVAALLATAAGILRLV